jgi:4-hydroxyphenylpyruvate dioxygenase
MPNSLPLKRIHHVEFIVGNAKQAAYFYRQALGFSQFAYLGPETGRRDRVSYALRQGKIIFVFTAPLTHEDPMNEFVTLHGDSVKDICFEVDDVDAVYEETTRRGAPPALEPEDLSDDHGLIRQAAICTYGDTIHSLISKQDYSGPFLPGYVAAEQPGQDAGLVAIDHIVGNVEDQQMDRWVDFYNTTLGFHQFVSFDDQDISTEYSALRSKVVANDNHQIMFPINEPADGLIPSQIQEYIDFHITAGVQHVALQTGDIIETVGAMRDHGVEFLPMPEGYYDTVWDRVGEIKEPRDQIADRQILVDRDDNGYLLQIFTKPLGDRPTFFLEIIQRCGSRSFGKGNFKALFETIEQEQRLRGSV